MFQLHNEQVLDHPRNNVPMDKDVDVLENLQFQQDNDNQQDMKYNQLKIASPRNHHMYLSDSFQAPTDQQCKTVPLDRF